MGTTRTLGRAPNQVEVTWDLEERTTIPSGKKFWILKIKVCNRTPRKLDLAIAENPWRAPRNTEKMQYDKDENDKEVPGSDAKFARAGAKSIQLDTGKCKTVEFTYDIQPGLAYTDIFERNADGSLPKNWTWGTVETLKPVQVSLAPRKQGRTFVVSLPTPLQMFLEGLHDGSVKAVVERIDVPDGFELAHAFPGVAVPFTLPPGERGSSIGILLRQLDGLPSGGRVSVTTWQRILEPEAFLDQPARSVSVDLVNDRDGPEIRVEKVHLGKNGMKLVASAEDTCSGVESVEAIVMGNDEHFCTLMPLTVDSMSGGALKQVEFSIPLSPDAAAPKLVLRAIDEVGNVTVLPVPNVSQDPCG